jgi:hypothetical protein
MSHFFPPQAHTLTPHSVDPVRFLYSSCRLRPAGSRLLARSELLPRDWPDLHRALLSRRARASVEILFKLARVHHNSVSASCPLSSFVYPSLAGLRVLLSQCRQSPRLISASTARTADSTSIPILARGRALLTSREPARGPRSRACRRATSHVSSHAPGAHPSRATALPLARSSADRMRDMVRSRLICFCFGHATFCCKKHVTLLDVCVSPVASSLSNHGPCVSSHGRSRRDEYMKYGH